MAYMDYMGFKSYFTGEDWETTLTEGNEAVADETSSIFSETSSPETSEECQGSDEKSRNQNLVHKIKRLTEKNQCLEVVIKNLKESYEKQLETKTAEVKHFAKCLEKQEERHQGEAQAYSKQHKCLQRKIDELTKSLSTMKSEKQKMEGINAADLKSKQKQLDDYSKRLLEERTKSTRLDQDLKHYMSRLSNEETKSKKLEEELRHYFSSYNYLLEGYNTLRDNYNHDIKKMAGETDHLKSRLTKKDEELRVLREELKEKTTRLASAFEKRLKHDQRRVENTIDFNTPTDIEKDFSDFFDGERIDACDVIESILHSEEEVDVEIYYPRLACIIFVTAYEQVKEAKEAACDLFGNVTRWLIEETPRMGLELCVSRKKGEFSCHLPVNIGDFLGRKNLEISRDVLDGLVLSLKQTAHLCDLDCFENVVKEIVWERWNRYLQEEKTQTLPAVHASRAQEVLTQLSDYIKACIRLTWKMVTQLPPLQLEYKSLKFDKAVHKLARFQCNTSDQRFGETATEDIACYLWPALIEGGGRIIFPGEVFSAFLADYVYL